MLKHPDHISKDSLYEKWFYWVLFLCLFTYAIFRAFLVVPMLDELSTFYSFIRTGLYFNSAESLSANNHILNSYFGHQLYYLFGDSFFLFRLSSLLALPIYFYSMKHIVQECLPKFNQIIVFLALVCIPWLFEYFSYSRGYSLAIASFFASISFAIKWRSIDHWKYLVGFFVCLWFSIASNLTYLLPSVILLIYIELIFLLKKDFSKQNIIVHMLLVLGWIMATIPFIKHSFKLKEAGELWWGNQDGLWETTGKSLSSLVLFTDSDWVFYLILILLLTCTATFIAQWSKNGFWTYLKQSESIIFSLFMASIVGIVAMRYLFDVNYPMDRVGMYLVPTFILFISLFLSKNRILKYLIFVLLFFPISFIDHMNVSTSIFSPEDRIPESQTDKIKALLTDQTALSAEYVSHMSYAYSCRDDKKVHIAYTADSDINNYGDYHISWQGCHPIEGYNYVSEHPISRTCLKQHNNSVQKKLIVDTLISNVNFSSEYFTILKRPIDSLFYDKQFQVQINGELEFEGPTLKFNMVQLTKNEEDDILSARSPIFNWYFSDRTDINFVFMDRVVKLQPDESLFHFFLLNGDLLKIKVKFIRVRIYQVMQQTEEAIKF